MKTFSELSFIGNKLDFDTFRDSVKDFTRLPWHYGASDKMMRDFIVFDYTGDKVDQAEVSIYYGSDIWRQGYIRVTNIVPLQKDELTIDEYNAVLHRFYEDIVKPYMAKHPELRVDGPTTDVFNPLDHISQEALNKLRLFCNAANKSTGSSHSSDEQRWYDFICQTVDDGRMFDYDTLYKFLRDEEYWGSKEKGFIGVMGSFAWNDEYASELASEYEQYTRVLEYYRNWKWEQERDGANSEG